MWGNGEPLVIFSWLPWENCELNVPRYRNAAGQTPHAWRSQAVFESNGLGPRRQRARDDACHEVIVVGLGNLGAIKLAGIQLFQIAEVVDKNLAVDLGSMELGAAFPKEFSLRAFALGEKNEF